MVEFLRAVSKFRKSKKKIAVHFCKLTSSIKREIRKFHVRAVRRRQRNVSESVMHEQICCCKVSLIKRLLFCRSCCRGCWLSTLEADCTHIFLVVVSENHKYLRTISKTLRKKSTLEELSRKSSRYPLYYFDLLTIVVHYPFSSHHPVQILDGPWTNSFAVCCCYNVCHYEQFTKVYYKWTRQN